MSQKKYILIFILFFSFDIYGATVVLDGSKTTFNQLCLKLNLLGRSPGSHKVTLRGTWNDILGCRVIVTSNVRSMFIDARQAQFISSMKIRDVILRFNRSEAYYKTSKVTDITWLGGVFDSTTANREQFSDGDNLHNVGTSLSFAYFNSVVVDGVKMSGGIDTSVPRASVVPGKDRYIGGDSGVTGVINESFEVKNSLFTGMVDAGVYIGGGNDPSPIDDGKKILVHDNIFIGNNVGAVFKRQANNVDVRANLFLRNVSGVITALIYVTIDGKTVALESAKDITVVKNTFVKQLGSAIRLRQVTGKGIAYGNKIYGLGVIDSHQSINTQNTNVTAIFFEQANGLIRMNQVYPKQIPGSVLFKNVDYSEAYTAPTQDSTTSVRVLNNSEKVDVSANDLRYAKQGLLLEGAKNVEFSGNMRGMFYAVRMYASADYKTSGSKIKVGLFSDNGKPIKVGLTEHLNNGGAFPINNYCSLKSEVEAGLYVNANSTTDSTLRIGSSNSYRHYVGNIRKANKSSCGF